MTKPMISARQFLFIVILIRISITVALLPEVTTVAVYQDVWLSGLLATALGLVIGILHTSLAMRFPGQSIGTFAHQSLGRILGGLVAMLFGMFFYLMALQRAQVLSLLIGTTMLRATPIWVLATAALLVGGYGAIMGADVLGRGSEYFITMIGGLVVTGFALLFAAPIRGDIGLLRPVLHNGFGPVIDATFPSLLWFASASATVFALGKYCTEPGALRRTVVKGHLVSGFILVSILLVVVTYVGPRESAQQFSPVLSLSREINVPLLAERLDAVAVSIWMTGLVFDVSVALLAAGIILGDLLNIETRWVVLVLSSAAIVLMYFEPVDVFAMRKILSPTSTMLVTGILHVGLVAFIYLGAVIRGREQGVAR